MQISERMMEVLRKLEAPDQPKREIWVPNKELRLHYRWNAYVRNQRVIAGSRVHMDDYVGTNTINALLARGLVSVHHKDLEGSMLLRINERGRKIAWATCP